MKRATVRALTAVVATALLVGACGRGGGAGYRITAYFPKAVALYPQSSVKVLGLPGGKVTSIDVVGRQVKVSMRIDRDVPLPADVHAMIVPFSLIGERYIQLFPAWTDGEARLRAGAVIPEARTTIPVEPDEALAAVKKFLDTLDPNATGRLVKNLAADLQGNGQNLNDTLRGLGTLTATLAEKDIQLGAIIDNFDRFTATLATREAQLGKVMDQFAGVTSLLAQERTAIQSLVQGLGRVSTDGLALIGEHKARLDKDLSTLTFVLEAVNANFESVRQLLSATPLLVAGPGLDGQRGLAAAWDPKYHHLDLRNSVAPTLTQLLTTVGGPALSVCVPVDVTCAPSPSSSPSGASSPAGTAASAAPARALARPVARDPATRPPSDGRRWLGRAVDFLAGAVG